MGYILRKADLKDRDAIISLLKESFGSYWSASQSLYTSEFWNWLYLHNPPGGSLVYVAEDNGRIIGHFPNVFEYIKIGDDIHKGGMVLHLTTHADYRKKGIFKNLGRLSIEELKKTGVPLSLAFPNDKSRPGFIDKLGFSPIATLPLLIKPLRIKTILNSRVKNKMLAAFLYCVVSPLYNVIFNHYMPRRTQKPVTIETREDIGAEFDILWKKAMSQASVMVPRDARFLRWRFLSRPNQDYKIFVALRDNALAGYLITREADIFSLRTGIIVDYLVLPGETGIFDRLLNTALAQFKKDGMDLCVAASLKHNVYYRTLKQSGFITIPERLNPRKLVLVGRLNALIPNKKAFLNKRDWFLTFGDWDIF